MPLDANPPITSCKVQTLRESYALNPGQFAKLMGVSLTTIYRWEALGETLNVRQTKTIAIEPLQRHLIACLSHIAIKNRPAIGAKIVIAMATRSRKPLYPLYVLLHSAFTKPVEAAAA